MIDTENLRTASLYINNQLLSRGLLRDGQSIDFASPAMNHGEDAATMGRIVSVLNDLIIRRDVSLVSWHRCDAANSNSGMRSTASRSQRRCGAFEPRT